MRVKRHVTHTTFVRFLCTVNSTVRNEITRVRKSFSANSTFKLFLSWMNLPVLFEVTAIATAFATLSALVFTYSTSILMPSQLAHRWKIFLAVITCAVNSAVHNKVMWRCKSFATYGTFKRFLSMTLCMLWQTSTTSETSATLSALVFICMNIHMLSQAAWRWKTPLTVITWIWFISTVNSAVLNKVTWRCKSFATYGTFKRFLCWMTSHVIRQTSTISKTFATHCALVWSCISIHMLSQAVHNK